MSDNPLIALPSGEKVAALGLGTWMMGERKNQRKEEVAALNLGLDLGLTLIDTAEMYANGGAEEVVAEAVAGCRDEAFIVSKVLPSNASMRGTIAACEKSLKRLKTDRIDLYLLHWPSNIPLAETVDGFTRLKHDGKIRHWGVSNFDAGEMEALFKIADGKACATNQVLYNLNRRGIEYDLVPWSHKHRMPIMAYSPLDQGRLLHARALNEIAARHNATAAQLALAWLLTQKNTIVIPKAGNEPHTRENAGALGIRLSEADRNALDRAFPPPGKKKPLEMI